MGKTFRKVHVNETSTSYHSPHDRGFAKKKKRHSHKKVRQQNANCNEDSYARLIDVKGDLLKHHPFHYYRGDLGNLPNKPGFHLTDKYLNREFDTKWEKDKSQLNFINRIDNGNQNDELRMCKKQLERRGKTELFYGHRL